MKNYVMGKGPFCKGQPADCDMPGFVPGKKVTSGCWTGSKQECVFDINEYRKTPLYNEIVMEKGEAFAEKHYPTKYYSKGTAPFCDGTPCDLVASGKYPIGSSINGMGKECISGEKVVGVDPFVDYQFKKIEHIKEECRKDKELADEKLIAKLNLGTKIVSTIGDIASNVASGGMAQGVKSIIKGVKDEIKGAKKEFDESLLNN